MRLSSRLIRGTLANPRREESFDENSSRLRIRKGEGRKRNRGGGHFDRMTVFAVLKGWEGPCSFGGRWQANARFGGKRLPRWKGRGGERNGGTSVCVVETSVECRHCRKSAARWKLLNPAWLSVFHWAQETSPSSSPRSFVIETKRKNNARDTRFSSLVITNPSLSTSLLPWDKLIAVSIKPQNALYSPPVSIVSLNRL